MELVERTLKVLLALSGAENGLSVSELSLQLELPPSSTHRILASLKKNGFALQDETTKRYRIGYRVLTLCQNIKQNNSLIATSHPFMKKLSEQLNKTVTLCVMEGDQIVCIDYIENKDTSMFYVRTGFAMPPYATSAGKVIQAYMNRKKVEKLACTQEMEPITPYTKTDFFSFLAELETIRKQGYAICDEELQLGIQGVACPVFDCKGEVVASVSFNALKSEFSLTEEAIEKLKDCALAISRNLGYQIL